MKSWFCLLATFLAWPNGFAQTNSVAATNAAAPSPNILLIVAGDLGWRDVGYQGADFYETPNIDQFSRQGIVFTQGYAGASEGAPSLACLLAGQYTPRHGVYAADGSARGPKDPMRLVPVSGRTGLAPATPTLAKSLKAAGYATALFGQWPVAGPEGTTPGQLGFDTVIDSAGHATDPQDPNGMFSLTRTTADWLQAHTNQPFFAFVAPRGFHGSQAARPETLKKFRAKKPGLFHTNAPYAAGLADFDQSVGLLLTRVRELGLFTNTLVIFTSSNGAAPESSQEPLRGNRGSYYEGGLRVPFIVRWPAVIRADSRSGIPVSHVDLFPTLLAAAGVPVPRDHLLDGEDLQPLLRGQRVPQRKSLFWHFPGYLDSPVIRGRDAVFGTRPVSVIRKGDWKLHLFHEEWLLNGGEPSSATNNAVELYNLTADAGERKNSAMHGSKREELLKDLLKWLDETGAPLAADPHPKPASKTEAKPKKETKAAPKPVPVKKR